MRYPNKVKSIDEALEPLRPGMRLMLGEFVGAGEAACCIQALLASGIGELTLIANTPGLRGGFLKAQLFASGQLAEFIGTHVGTTDESTAAYLSDAVRVAEFFPMGTWAEKVRAGAMGLGGVLIPVGIGILDEHRARKLCPPGVRMVRFVDPVPTSTLALVWRPDTTGAPVDKFVELCRDAMVAVEA